MKYWPGSNVVKSEGNAFDWRSPELQEFLRGFMQPDTSRPQAVLPVSRDIEAWRVFTIYSKARSM